MSKNVGSIKGPNIVRSVLTVLFLSLSIVPLNSLSEGGRYPDGPGSFEEGEGTRTGDVLDFDVQFLLEPSDDVLNPLYGEKYVMFAPGMEATYWVMISNIGHENDTFHLELAGPSWDTGYDYFFMDQKSREVDVQLTSCELRDLYGGRSVATFPVHLIVPVGSSKDSRTPITVNAISLTDLETLGADLLVDSDDLFIIIGETQTLYIPDRDQGIFHVETGEWLTIPFHLHNNGNKDTIDITVQVEEDAFWRSTYRDFEYVYTRNSYLLEFEWTSAHLSVEQGKTVYKDIRVRVPAELFGSDEVFQFRVYAHFDGYSNYGTSKVYTIITKDIIHVNAYLAKEGIIDIIAGEKNKTEVLVDNDRWENDFIDEVYLLDPNGVKIQVFNDTMSPFSELEVPRNEEITFFVEFQIPNLTPPGLLDLTLVMRPRYFQTIFLNIILNVNVNKTIVLLPTDTLLPSEIPFLPGKFRSLVFGVRNEGNTFQNVSLDLRGTEIYNSLLGSGWSSRTEWVSQVREPPYFKELRPIEMPILIYGSDPDLGYLIPLSLDGNGVTFGVAPGDTVWASLKVECPDKGGGSIVPSLTVRAVLWSDDDEVLAEMIRELTVDYPDLEVTRFTVTEDKGKLIDSANNDQKVLVTFNVTNRGTGYSNWVEAEIRADDDKVLDVSIRPLAPGEWVELTREVSAIGGTKELRLELDPENQEIESNDQFMEDSSEGANIATVPLAVEDEDGTSHGVLYLILAVILVVLVLAVLLLIASSRKRSREEEN